MKIAAALANSFDMELSQFFLTFGLAFVVLLAGAGLLVADTVTPVVLHGTTTISVHSDGNIW